jgi:hypothetical protein
MWEVQAPHEYKTGIALELYMPFGRHFFVVLTDRNRYR